MSGKLNSFAFQIIGRVVQAIIALIALRLATSYLTIDQFGLFGLLMAFRGFFGLFLINPVGQHLNRNTHKWFGDGSILRYLKKYNIYIILVSVFSIFTVYVWAVLRNKLDGDVVIIASLSMGLVVYFGTWNSTLIPMLNLIGYRKSSVLLEFLTSSLALFCSFLLVVEFNSGVGWFAGSVIGLGIGAYIAFSLVRSKSVINTSENGQFVNLDIIANYILPLGISTGFMWLLSTGYRFIIEWGWGEISLGLIVVAFGISSQLWAIFESMVMQVLMPHFYKAINEANYDQRKIAYENLINAVAPLYLIFLGATMSLSELILSVLTDAKFHDAFTYVMFGTLIECCRAMANLLSQASQITKNTRSNIMPYAIASGFAIFGVLVAALNSCTLSVVAIILSVSGIILLMAMRIKTRNIIPVKVNYRALVAPLIYVLGSVGIGLVIGYQQKTFVFSLFLFGIFGLLSCLISITYLYKCKPFRNLLSVRLIS